ncbi:methionyl-tRNA formyltransferase [Thermosporothrix hazakensis]|uniref:Methionyl-tRNA formyltransferase n=2 Tax=Thermosporothrix TaxID=768650 RepID=A0A326U5C1_THEHA|nr:methionyl-tRNA formyltransferase [Thermosporothrix hazakensis]PZW26644.1 methionyl-tRNA formyltransferase [Thermosporothrix hazakensis]BBH89470.1 methionyl-tRNA formyltransferase [Thermosporothrix sp. COM3]GCE47654.1 methionyl-tRNA formyltransferase [Thermosporothrix hazakensis]
MLRIIYMGTPQFAVPALEALVQHSAPGKLLPEGYEIATVITRPDKPAGRGRGILFSPVKQAALAHHLPVWQPGSFKKAANREELAAYKADLYIVAAFGQILPQAVLDQPRYGTLNIHASLLPKYRGADPIAESILQGDTETGVSIMLLDAGIDTGPVLLRRSIPIAEDDTTGTLTGKLAELGAKALLEALPRWIAGEIQPEPQDEERASHTRMLQKEDGLIDWTKPAGVIARQVRAYSPWPGTYTYWRGKLLKIHAAKAVALEPAKPVPPGTVAVREEAGHVYMGVVTGSSYLLIKQLQLEGKKAMSTEEFLRGYRQIVGEVLGAPSQA